MTSEERFFIALLCLILMAVALPGCTTTKQVPVTVTKTVEVKVPVSSPCVTARPDEVVALRDKMTADEWRSLTTDQREKLLGAQALDRKAQHDKLLVATAGCH